MVARITSALLAASLLALAGCSSGASGGAGASSSPTRSTTTVTERDDCAPGHDHPPAGAPVVRSMTFAGSKRVFRVTLPPRYDGRHAVPLILVFHGFLSSKEKIDADTALDVRGAADGFAVVTPDSLGSPMQWNIFGAEDQAPDYAFVAALIHHLKADFCVDPRRIFAAGHSNGSAFSGFLPCQVPHTFAAIAMVSATIPPICPKQQQYSVLAIVGTADPQVPADGGTVGGSTTGIPPATTTMASYRKDYGCRAVPRVRQPIAGVEETSGVACRHGRQVILDRVIGGTHPWPGGPAARQDRTESEAGRTFDATGAVLALFLST